MAFLDSNTNYSFAGRDAALPDTSLFHHRTVFDAVYSDLWVMAMLISLHSLRKQRIALTESIIQNLFIVSLALTTVIVAVSACIVYSETIHFEKYHNNLMDLQGISPPNPFAICYGLGILFCESAWIITGLLKCLEHLKKSRR